MDPEHEREYSALTEITPALEALTLSEAEDLKKEAIEKGVQVEWVPAKALLLRKAPVGKHKCRAVACGSHMTQQSQEDTHAGGASAVEARLSFSTCPRLDGKQ